MVGSPIRRQSAENGRDIEKNYEQHAGQYQIFRFLAAYVEVEPILLTTKQAKNDVKCRKFVELGVQRSISISARMSEQGEEPPVNVLHDAKNSL